MQKTGKISIDSQNIMPVIKKWLYSDKEIFLREIVSNAADAVSKHKKLANIGEAEASAESYRIEVVADKENGTLKISDNGIGMTADEVEKYIAQVAFSGAEDFAEKYKSAGKDGIIGHFGLGFYSSYMVANLVEIDTLSYVPGSAPARWSSDGNIDYTLEEGARVARGTTITLHLADDEKEYLDQYKLSSLLHKYCAFMPVEIYLNPKGEEGDKPVNDISPLWLKDPKTATDEEYKEFYQKTFSDFTEPLFWIHLNVDYPFNVKGILYFPRQKNPMEVMQGEVKLYCNQVFIADNVKEVVPEFLMLLKGVLDSSDIPLNVSRSFLQNDRDVQRLSKHITKKVADKLSELFAEDRARFEGFYDDIAPFIKFGCIKDESFYDKVKDILLFKDTDGKYETLSELSERLPESAPEVPPAEGEEADKKAEKPPKKVYYVTDESAQGAYIESFKRHGVPAVILKHYIDTHFISFLEYKERGFRFLRIDAETPDALKSDAKLDNEAQTIELFKQNIADKEVKVEAAGLKGTMLPATAQVNEYSRRFSDMNGMYGNLGANMKEEVTITLNTESPVIQNLAKLPEDKLSTVCAQIYDLALISGRSLTPKAMSDFLERSAELLAEFVKE